MTIEESLKQAYETKDYSQLQTRDGHSVLFLGRSEDKIYPWNIAFETKPGFCSWNSITSGGRSCTGEETPLDIVLRPRAHRVWVAVARRTDGSEFTHSFISHTAFTRANETWKASGVVILSTGVFELTEGEFIKE